MGVVLSAHTTVTDEIAFRIADHCDTQSVMRLMAVCNAWQHVMRRYKTRVYDANTILEPFFGCCSGCLDFRRVLADTGALVSGSQAIQLLTRNRNFNSDSTLDIYVHCLQSEYLARCLLQQGYRYVPTGTRTARWSQLCGVASEYHRNNE